VHEAYRTASTVGNRAARRWVTQRRMTSTLILACATTLMFPSTATRLRNIYSKEQSITLARSNLDRMAVSLKYSHQVIWPLRQTLPWYHTTLTDSSFMCQLSPQARHARTRLSLFQSLLRVDPRMIHNTPTRPSAAVRPSRQKPTCMCKAYPIDVYPREGHSAAAHSALTPNSRSIPCGSLEHVSALSTYSVSRLCLCGRYEEKAG
jgi:hypothetical protein